MNQLPPDTPAPLDTEVVLRVIPMPSDTIMNDLISGGWVMSKLDSAGSVLPMRLSRRLVALIAVDRLVFEKPIFLGDLVTFYATVIKIGTTSITVCVEATTESRIGGPPTKVTECRMTYVALDDDRRPVNVRGEIARY